MALQDEYSTISEAARDLGVTRQTVSRWIASGQLPAERIGREKLIKKEDIFAFSFNRNYEWLARAVPNLLIGHLRKDYEFTEGETLERLPNSFDICVRKQDGTLDIIEFKGLRMGFENRRAIVNYDEVVRRPYENP
jgi:excisionase family DNA binding protein